MAYSLKNLPPLYPRPLPPKASRWLISLATMLAVSMILMRLFGRYIDGQDFWLLALGAPGFIWGVAVSGRLLIWMLKDITANGFDKRREAWILHETRRARRAMQVLGTSLVTGHPDNSCEEVVAAMLANQNIIASQVDWQGNEGQRLSRIDAESGEIPAAVIERMLVQLIEDLPLTQLPDSASLVVAFDVSSSCSLPDVYDAWRAAWDASELALSVELAESGGLACLNRWLDNRIRDNALLLIIGLQVAPYQTDYSAEAAVALLLGNRLTQETLLPHSFLHRPEPALPGQLEDGMCMAAYNVPLKEHAVTHLWLAGLSQVQLADVVTHQQKYPLQDIAQEAVIALDNTMGHAGAAAPWLAIAAAAQVARDSQQSQIVICGDLTQDVLWSTLITSEAYRKEMDS